MGRIKTIFIKRVGQDIYEKHSDEFSTDFSKNKEVIKKFLIIKSKKMRNVITGYVTSLKKQDSN
jgi:small subunit ribosomal protein S17e